jgi:putative ABC transport system permease protein
MRALVTAARFARRELRGGLRGFWVFLSCLTLGVAAIAAVGTVRASIEAGLLQEGSILLGGDAEIELSYRFATETERGWMDETAVAVSEIVDFRSMAVAGTGGTAERGLTQVKAVDDAYPLTGVATLEPAIGFDVALAGQDGMPGAVMDPVLIGRLGLRVGQQFRLGAQAFILMAALEVEPDNASGGFSLGPRTIVATEALADSGLLGAGTVFNTAYRMMLPAGTNPDVTRAAAEEAFGGAGIRWHDWRNGAPAAARFVERLAAFLVLVGLAGLAVGGVGVSAAVRAYLDEKTQVIATLKTLGAASKVIFLTYFIQIGVLTFVGVAAGLVLGAGVPLLLAPVLSALLPLPVVDGVFAGPLIEAAVYGFLTALIFTLWPLARASDVRAATLFRDADLGSGSWPRWPWVLVTALLLALLVALAVWLTGVAMLALWSAVGIFGAFALLVGAAWGIRRLSRWLAHLPVVQGRVALRLALGAVGGPGGETLSVVLSLGLGLSVLAAVGQIDSNLRGAIARDLPDVAPSFFVVDIQRDQLEPLRLRVEADSAVSRFEAAPMLRGVLTEINGGPAEDVVGEHWVIQGDRGLTYADAKPDNARIVEGEWWPEGYAGAPQVSFAAEEGREMGLKLGDTVTVNILGRDITATLTSFREVDFSQAGMGFVMTFNEAALVAAPHSYIATIYAEEAAEPALLRDISSSWPNITAIRVRDVIARVAELMTGIAAATTFGALATLITGAVVLIGAAAAGARGREYEAAVLKTLGASRARILASFALRSVLTGAAAGVVATGAGALAGWAVTTQVMESSYTFEPVSALLIIAGGILLTLLTGLGFAWRALAVRPAQVLRARD